ncbi:MAG: transglycosylase domain-containing protein, partial [Clostridia bacterium]|nr:transglycosylase domain-containing protein [Clostridia bacterium]
MKVVLKVLKILLFTLVLGLIFIICGLVYFFIVNQGVYLDTSKLTKNTLVYEFYDANNTLFYKQNGKNGENYVELSTLNDYTINAFISIEDKRFYSHNGVDVKRILGAILSNVKALKIKEGASTISQQLIKNTHLSSEKTLKRKLNEIYLTMQLENRYTKNEILEIYLNTIYFGGGAYGINDASKLYFNKNASDLTLNESATFAGLIKAPN